MDLTVATGLGPAFGTPVGNIENKGEAAAVGKGVAVAVGTGVGLAGGIAVGTDVCSACCGALRDSCEAAGTGAVPHATSTRITVDIPADVSQPGILRRRDLSAITDISLREIRPV